MTKSMHQIREMLCEEADKIASKGALSMSDLETINKVTDTIKNIYKIEMMDSGDYSEAGGWRAMGTYNDGTSYGGTHYVRGHYSRNPYYSKAEGKQAILEQIQDMMQDQDLTQSERTSLKRAADAMRDSR